MAEIDYEKVLRDFVKAVQTASSEHKYYYDLVGKYDKGSQDYIHQIELGKASERAKYATRFARHLEERRFVKDKVARTAPIAQWLNDNQAQFKAIERLLGDVRRETDKLKNRKYKARVVQDLSICKEDEPKKKIQSKKQTIQVEESKSTNRAKIKTAINSEGVTLNA